MDSTSEALCEVMLFESSCHAHISGMCACTNAHSQSHFSRREVIAPSHMATHGMWCTMMLIVKPLQQMKSQPLISIHSVLMCSTTTALLNGIRHFMPIRDGPTAVLYKLVHFDVTAGKPHSQRHWKSATTCARHNMRPHRPTLHLYFFACSTLL